MRKNNNNNNRMFQYENVSTVDLYRNGRVCRTDTQTTVSKESEPDKIEKTKIWT